MICIFIDIVLGFEEGIVIGLEDIIVGIKVETVFEFLKEIL